MYKKFLFLSALLITTSVFAFGGGGPGRIRVHYRRGVDAVGVHRDSSGDQGDFCMYDLSGDPNAEEISTGVFQCKGGSFLNCDTGVCTPCAAGTYAAAGDESCSTTPAGSYTPEGASAPIPCPDGTYQPEAGQSACIEVTPGYEPAVPIPDDEVPCSDTTTKGACGCPSDQYADGAGNCVPDSCKGVWINECTPSCTQATGPTHLDDGTGCQDNLGTCQNGVCCGGENCVTEQYPELYCLDTNNQGQCTQWSSCQEGQSTQDWIIGTASATGHCCPDGQTPQHDGSCLAPCGENQHRDTNNECVCDDGYVLDENDTCIQIEGKSCTATFTNADCGGDGSGYYCNITEYSDCSPSASTCQQITSSNYADIDVEGLGDIRRSNNKTTWWTADNWCKAQGMQLIDVSKFGCYKTGTTTLVEEGTEYLDGCCASGQTCTYSSKWYI